MVLNWNSSRSVVTRCTVLARRRFRCAVSCAGADWSKTFYQILTNQPGKDSWPITGATFIMMHTKQDKPQQASAALRFFDWAFANGDKMSDDLDYVPLPESVEAIIRQQWGKITDASGKAVLSK